MLTKDLLRHTCRKGRIYPTMLKSNETNLELAQRLLDLYEFGVGEQRSVLEEEASHVCNAFGTVKVAKGFNKLCLDRCEFSSTANNGCFADKRRELFDKSATLLSQGDFGSMVTFRQKVMEDSDDGFDIYGDLPGADNLLKFKKISAEELLNRYNVSQVQGLLLSAQSICLTLKKPEIAALRRLLRYLKFFRLLAEVRIVGPGLYEMKVDGPLSILESTKKYGLQLASFFTAVVDLPKWSLTAEVKVGSGCFNLELDQKSKLRSWYKNFLAYVPEEIRLFADSFKEKESEWSFVSNPPIITMPDQRLVFPDFCFENSKGNKVALELFHSWHAGPLIQRLDEWPSIEEELILGVDRAVVKKMGLEKDLGKHSLFEERGFLYRDFPGVQAVRRILKNVSCR